MKVQFSNISIIIVVLVCFIIDLSLKNWEKPDRVIEHDVHWYYAYLPSIFIYNDIKQDKSDYRFEGDYYLFWPTITTDGKKVTKTTMGLSILYAPFFFVAHGYSILSNLFTGQEGYPANGFSEPYKVFLLLSTIFYLMIGLDFLKKTLRQYGFSDIHTGITILLIGLGTNLLCYSSQSAPHAHVYNFCLFSVFIFYTISWHKLPSKKNSVVLGLLLGLISLIRPSNAVIMLFFLCYGVSNLSELKQRILLFKKEYFLFAIIFFLAFVVWIPQFLYWKTVTGHYLFYSYTHERFFFDNPKILQGLFSFRKGWLVYTPMMGFALLGIFFLKNDLKKLRIGIILFFIANIYIIFSWWCWWYGGTYGQRTLIESYAVLAIPLCSFIKYISEKKVVIRVAFYSIAAFFIWLNIFQTFQFEYGVLHWDGMTKELYFKQFGRIAKISDFDMYVDWPDYKKAASDGRMENTTKQSSVKDDFNGKKEVGRIIVQLKAINDKYVCADGTLNHLVIANKEIASTWETFIIIKFENNECAILAYNERYLGIESGNNDEITATKEKVGTLETFIITELDSNFVALKASNGKYVGVNETVNGCQLLANSQILGQKERFMMTKPD